MYNHFLFTANLFFDSCHFCPTRGFYNKMSTCKVHNVRFYKLEPKGINCFSYLKKKKKLALSRFVAVVFLG